MKSSIDLPIPASVSTESKAVIEEKKSSTELVYMSGDAAVYDEKSLNPESLNDLAYYWKNGENRCLTAKHTELIRLSGLSKEAAAERDKLLEDLLVYLNGYYQIQLDGQRLYTHNIHSTWRTKQVIEWNISEFRMGNIPSVKILTVKLPVLGGYCQSLGYEHDRFEDPSMSCRDSKVLLNILQEFQRNGLDFHIGEGGGGRCYFINLMNEEYVLQKMQNELQCASEASKTLLSTNMTPDPIRLCVSYLTFFSPDRVKQYASAPSYQAPKLG